MAKVKFISNIQIRVEKILKKFGLSPLKAFKIVPFQQDHDYYIFHNFHVTPAVNKRGERFIFKCSILDNKYIREDLRREITFYKTCSTLPRTSNSFLPKYAKSNTKTEPNWLLYQYIEGELAGDTHKLHGFKKETLTPNLLSSFVKVLTSMPKLKKRVEQSIHLDKHGSYWYLTDFKFYRKQLWSFLDKRLLKKHHDLLIQSQKLLDNSCNALVHGDFYPNNIIVKKNKVYIIDWESIHLNNYVFDFGFAWMMSWRNKQWQENLLKNFLRRVENKKEFQKLFQIVILSLGLRFIFHARRTMTTRRKFYSAASIKIAKQVLPLHLEIYKRFLFKC